MSTIADFRRQYPQYDDMSDVELADAIHKKYYSDLPKADVFKRLEVKVPAPVAAPEAAPVPTAPEEEGFFSAIGRAAKRGVPALRQGVAQIIEDYPEIVASAYASVNPNGIISDDTIRGLGKAAAKSETYEDLTGEVVASERKAAEKQLADIGPRKYGGFFEEEGFGRSLGSLAETVAESALPVGAGVATGLATRSPMAAGIVMGAGNVPMTYGGIRERQQAEGIDNVDRAVFGTAASSALDVLTGVGGKVLTGTAAVAARELLEAGLRQAAVRVVKSGGEEAGTEMLQNVIEQVAGGTNPTTKKAMLETMEAGLAGALGGTVFTGATEAIAAPFRPKAGSETETKLADSPQVEQEFYRLVAAETQALREQNPDLTQRQAYNQAVKDAGKLYDTAIANTMFGTEGDIDVADVDTGVDDLGGTGTGAAADIGTASSIPGVADVGETVGGGLEQSVSGVSVPTTGTDEGVGALGEAKDILANKKVKLTERVDVARQLLNDTILSNKLVNDVDQKQYDAAKKQLANGKHGGDPMAALEAVTGKKFGAPLDTNETVAAPTAETAPSLDVQAVAPVKAAIKSVTAPAPTDTSPIPSLAQASAQEVGIAPEVTTPDVAVQEDVQGYVDTRRQELAAQEAADAEAEATLRQEIATRELATEEVVPAPVAEEVAPEVAAAPVEEAAPEIDPYDALLEEIETARWDEEAGQQIDDKAYNLLANATENRRKSVEEIRAVLEGAKTRYAEQVMGGERFRPGEPGNITVDEVAPIVASVAQRTGVQAPSVVQSVTDLPASVQGAISSGEALSPSGVVDADGNVYIVADNLNTAEEATATLFHETLGHIGLAKQFRQRLDKVLRGMYDTNRNLRAETDAWRAQNPNAYSGDTDPLARAVEEVLAQRSEAGRIEASLFAKLAAIVKDFARRMRIKADFSDAEITTILAMAHDRAVREGSKIGPASARFQKRKAPTPAATPTPKVVSNGKQVVLTEAQKRTALAKAKATRERMNRIQKRIASTNDTADVLSDGIDLVKLARGDKENLALLRGAIDTVDIGKWQLILPTLSTEDIFRILKGRIPGLIEADRIIQQDVTRFQTKEYLRLADELEQVAEFLKKYPKAAQALSDLEFASVAYQVDPTKAATPEDYAKLDKKTKELQTELSGVTAGDVKGKKKVEDKIARRLAEIKSVYVGVPGDERVLGWRDLGRPEFGGGKGREIFKLLRDGHRRDLEAKYNALRDRLKETKKDKELAGALEKLEAQFKPAMDQVIYFPAMRFGSYYARVGSGATSVFKMFETQTQRNQFVRVMKARGQEVTDTGNVEDLRNNFEQVTGGPLKEVLDLFDGDPKDIGALKSQVFDLWLQTMSAGDMRKHMAPRKMRAGYSTDILKNFANFRRSSVNDVKRAKFGYKLRTQISSAKDSLEGTPDREKMNAFIKEIELRTLSDLMPPEQGNPYWEGAIQLGNKMAFYQYLANPKTALIQLTQLHIVALPMLAQKYGSAKATAALSKYGFSSLGGFVTSPLKAIKREDGKFTFDWEQPNLLDNPISALKEESDPELYELLSEGWTEGRDLNLWMDTFANQIGGYGNADPQQTSALQELMKGRVHTAAWRGTTFAFEAMGTLMHQMERVNREATYMAALELAYRENKKNGQTHAEAKKNAIEAAVETTLAATFDFSSYNKPRVLNTGVGRLAGQFMSYPYMMTSLLARNMYTAIKFGELEPGERKAAIQTATGALFNIGLYAGLTGVPLYGLFTTIASLLLWAFGDDDEEEGGLSYIDKDGNIKATYNIDWWVRNVWIPKTFGPDGTVANLFDLDDDTAEVLARSVEKGPISAITDIDLSNSVALDFMFFVPRESRADTPEGKVVDYTFSAVTGAAGNMVMDYIKAGKDLMNGYTARALEKTPKLFSNIAKANRFATEGQTNYNRDLVGMDANFWSSDKAILQGLGFASTEADQRQQQNYEAKSINVKVEKARADFLDKLRKTALDRYQYGSTPETDAAQQQIVKDWVEFNRTYPTHVIGLDSFYEVQNNAVTAAAESYGTRGLPLDEKTPYLRDIYLRRLKTEEK